MGFLSDHRVPAGEQKKKSISRRVAGTQRRREKKQVFSAGAHESVA